MSRTNPCNRIHTGGIADKNRLLLKVLADVLGKRIQFARSEQGSALGSVIHASVAAGFHKAFSTANAAMGGERNQIF